MLTTPNLALKKPETNDAVNIADLNYNADILDQEVAKRIINAGGVPSIQAGLDSEKPAPGTAGRLYVATDTQMIYRDTGTAWQKVGAVKWDDIEGKPDLALAADLAAHLAEKATHGVGSGYYIAKTSRSDQLPAWNDIQGKPSTFAPAAHNHNGSDITSPVASATNADTVDGKHASDFMSSNKAYGNVTYNDTIGAGQTLTKNIALGGNYKHGIAVIRPQVFYPAIMVFFGTNNLKTKACGYFHNLDTLRYGTAWTREWLGSVTNNYFGSKIASIDSEKVYILDVYISGTNLVVVFKNNDSVTRSLSTQIEWEVW